MPDRLSKVKAFMFGQSPVADDDDFRSEYAENVEDEPTDVVDYATPARSVAGSGPARMVREPAGATVTPIDRVRRGVPAAVPVGPSQIVHVRPRAFAEAPSIADSFRDGLPVILNLTVTEESQAQKLIDFCSGMAFVTGGSLERITSRVFLLKPAGVILTEADRSQLSSETLLSS